MTVVKAMATLHLFIELASEGENQGQGMTKKSDHLISLPIFNWFLSIEDGEGDNMIRLFSRVLTKIFCCFNGEFYEQMVPLSLETGNFCMDSSEKATLSRAAYKPIAASSTSFVTS
jgi:hypothetical protein